MALEIYRKKRKFGVTAEPRGRKSSRAGDRYVIQKHAATRLHYDLRLELDGVMKSWAVTRGPSLDPGEKRLAVHVEDHPIEYNSFEGTIPEGEYGGGTVMIWDRGRWHPEGDPHKGYAKGHLIFDLDGEKLHGRWHLVRMRSRPNERRENWLLIKAKDEEARGARDKDVLEEEPRSVVTGRSIDEIAAGKGRKRVWHSNRAGNGTAKAKKKSAAKAGRATGREVKVTRPKARTKAAAMTVAQMRGAARAAPERPKSRLPDFVPPSLATLHDRAPGGPQWIHEIKFDGYRIQARLDHGKVRLLTRKQQDWTHRFEIVADAVAELAADTALIDGELAVEDESGVSSFSQLQTDLKEGQGDRFVYYAFDLLHLDGRDLTALPLIERKAALRRLLKASHDTGPIRFSEGFDEDGATMLEHACRMHLEGIVSKRKDAPYRSGRSENFVKTKCHDRQELVVAGFTPSAAVPRAVGALTVGVYQNGRFTYAGGIGTGFSHAMARDLWKRLEKLRADKPPFALPADERRKNVIWVKPQMVIEAEFRGWTHGQVLRQAAFKGVREDKAATDVVREEPKDMAAKPAKRKPAIASAAKPSGAASAHKLSGRKASARKASAHRVADVTLTHPDRVYWVDVGVTKEDLAQYYVAIWDWIAPHVVRRPLALVRCPEGTKGQCFFQKHVAAGITDSKLRHVVHGKERDVIAVEHVDDLISLVQSGVLEIHTRGSTLERLEFCDRVVFDLDPGSGVEWAKLVAAAREVRERLASLKLESFVKLSGGKGMHVVLPIGGADWDTTKAFAQKIAMAMAADNPELYVAKMTKSLRGGRIFIDYLRNSREATSVAPYSTRARAGAPVSAPVAWDELGRTTGGGQFTVLNLQKRLGRLKHDPWAQIGRVKQNLPDVKRARK